MAGDDKKPTQPAATVVVPGTGAPRGSGSDFGFTPASDAAASYRPIRPGDVLNHIFEVKRFIARGGMGEVFEGINVNSDERVAIKVILPHLAADPNVQAMFRKEARTLTRLGHPALVQYRVLAQEPQFGVLYIVTEYVDGTNLSQVIGELETSPQDLVNLIRRLASGLQTAHALGAIHRDMSPDNIMLEGGVLSGARIIDFGIAKDLDPGSATIVGDGFAGKLNYVAPEQLGDFDREVGPWTDIYSLGLTILAVAGRKDVDMGTTMVNAVDKRRAGPDLSAAPAELHPLLSHMLKANPQERVRSMAELLDLLPVIPVAAAPPPSPVEPEPVEPEPVELPPVDPEPVEPEAAEPEPPAEAEPAAEAEPPAAWPAPEPAPEPEAAAWEAPAIVEAPPPSEPVAEPAPRPEPVVSAPAAHSVPAKSGKGPLVLVGLLVAVLLAAGAWYVLFANKGGGSANWESAPVAGPAAVPKAGGDDSTEAARTALAAALPSIDCTWLDVAQVARQGDGLSVALRGVAGRPDAVQEQVASLLAGKNLKNVTISMRDVATIEASECGPLDALRAIRDAGGQRMVVEHPQIEMAKMTAGNLAGTVGATAVVDFNLGDPGQEMSLFGVQPSGKISQLTTERAELVGASTDIGGGRYRLPIDVDHPGWSGLVLLTGQKPFDGDLLAGPAGSRTGDWSQRFIAAAKERGWKAEMVWFNAVNDQPD